jgi:hypothetical protein
MGQCFDLCPVVSRTEHEQDVYTGIAKKCIQVRRN